MKTSDFSRYAFGICVAIAVLAGCNSGGRSRRSAARPGEYGSTKC